jgi:hypothetical protein
MAVVVEVKESIIVIVVSMGFGFALLLKIQICAEFTPTGQIRKRQ